MGTFQKKVAVIGGGFCGLYAVAALIEEGGLDPICFEKTDKPFGTWCYREQSVNGTGSVMPTTILNQNKEIGALSAFPPRKETNIFMKHDECYRYLMDHAEKWGVLNHVQYNMEVILVKRSEDYEDTGSWVVTVRNLITDKVSTDVYDGVLVCVGQFNKPKMPTYEGQEKFKGMVVHTHTLKGVEAYREKNVIVVGMGCSGLDAAVETSNVAKQVYLSTRSGAHVLNRKANKGVPYDYFVYRRSFLILLDILPTNWVSWIFENGITNETFNQNLYAVPPEHHILSKDPVINDHIAYKLISGAVIQKPNIDQFTEGGVIFQGESEVTKADVIIMATGYTWSFAFLEEGTVVKEENGRFNLYKNIFPPHLKHGTLSIIGFVLPFGPGFPVAENQIRWAVQILAGNCHLPTEEVMKDDIQRRYTRCLADYIHDDKLSVRTHALQYCDEIASQFGAKPDLGKILVTDPKLFMRLVFGPCLAYQYRLTGPHSWDGAREAIMTSDERLFYPLVKNNTPSGEAFFLRLFKKMLKFLLL